MPDQSNDGVSRITMPACAAFLAEPHRYKVMYGGRNGVKSWSMARQLLINAVSRPIRWLCCREQMNTIADSVHALLSDQIKLMGMSAHFEIQKSAIIGINGSRFAFAGLRSLKHDLTSMKAYESFDGAWLEEGQSASHTGWETLIPTIRKQGSEIWCSFNPELETDDTWKRFLVNPPVNAMVVKTSYRDNLWLSDEARADMEHLRQTDPDEFEHIYEGSCVQTIQGAIYAKELRQTDADGRITRVPYEPSRPVFTFWDIGDRWTSIWFAQSFPYEYRLIDYLEDEALSLAQYFKLVQNKPYVYARHWLPHDAKATQLGTGRTIEEQAKSIVGSDKVGVLPRMSLADGINAVRTIFPKCWFDGDKCADGLQALRHYKWIPDGTQGAQHREPFHDWASHPADAFRYFAMGIKDQQYAQKPKPAPQPVYVGAWS